MMRVQAIASGSNGNSIYVEENETRVLIDAGISCKRIRTALEALGTEPSLLNAVFLTHEHTDHTTGIPVLLRQISAPVYATKGTADRVLLQDKTRLSGHPMFREVIPYRPIEVGSLRVLPVPTYHDAADPVFYRVDSDDRSFAVMTDTGRVDERMAEQLFGLDGILLESNHDVRMLELGSYPYQLKRRILSDFGHLSNESAVEVLERVISPKLKVILLGHLSDENNYPELADLGLQQFLKALPAERKHPGLRTEIAVRTAPSGILEF